MGKHDAPFDGESVEVGGKKIKWNIVRRTIYLVAGFLMAALVKFGVMDQDSANSISEDVTYLVTTGLFFVAAWFTGDE